MIDLKKIILENQSRENITQKERDSLIADLECFASNIKCSDIELLSREFNYVTWIDDDFMNDENLVFNYESFYKIDEYVKYLNPNHFSVMQLIKRETMLAD